MEIRNIHLVYFSATYTTRKIVREIARAFGGNVTEHDVTCGLPFGELNLGGEGNLLIAGAPVYAGRLPVRAARAFAMLRGTQTPAIAVSVYGNRDYDDALVETQDIIEAHGFKTVAAAAFIGRHCIFPKVAPGRPDADDMAKAAGFGADCARLLAGTDDAAAMPRLAVKGNRPYKQGGASTFSPAGTEETCSRCMTCASRCPMEAIPADKPWLTDGDKCIACGRCVVVCPERSRSFGGEAYRTFESKFVSAFSARREPETFFPESR